MVINFKNRYNDEPLRYEISDEELDTYDYHYPDVYAPLLQYIINIPHEMRIVLPRRDKTTLKQRFHLDIDEDGDIYYNSDLRSLCGHVTYMDAEEMDITLFPTYYAKSWEDTFFRLLMEATTIG